MGDEIEISGLLYKRRGGFGKMMPNAWQYRFFTISKEGILSYYDTDLPEPNLFENKPRGRLDLRIGNTEIIMNGQIEGAPTPFTIQVCPPSEEKWKLCADSKEEMIRWCSIMESHVNTKSLGRRSIVSYTSDDESGAASPSHRNRSESTGAENLKEKSPNEEKISPSISLTPKESFVNPSASSDVKNIEVGDANKKKRKGGLRVGGAKDGEESRESQESLLCLLILNCCIYLGFSAKSWWLKLLCFIVGNVVVGASLHFRAKRLKACRQKLHDTNATIEKLNKTISKIENMRQTQGGEGAEKIAASHLENEDEEEEEVVERSVARIPAGISGKPIAGYTLRQVQTPPLQSPEHTWCICDHRLFNVRIGPDYNRFKKKAPSAAPLFEAFAVDVFCTKNRIDHAASRFELPDTSDIDTHHQFVPPIIVVQVQIPSEPPPSLFSSVEDGPGWAIVMYFKITQDTLEQLKDISTASPAVKLFAQYCEKAPNDPSWRARFKVICSCLNLEELGMPAIIQSYNAKPVLIRRTGSIFKGPNYMELDIHVHKFANLAKQSIHMITSRCGLMYMQIGFVVEGREDSELPETLFAAAGVNRPQEESAEFIFD